MRHREYYSFHRKSDLPEGESKRGPPKRGPATELKTGRQETGCLALDRENSYDECVTTEAYGRASFDSPIPDKSEVTRRCDLVPNQIFEIRKSEGGFSQERSPFAFCDVDHSEIRRKAGPSSSLRLGHFCRSAGICRISGFARVTFSCASSGDAGVYLFLLT
jgi:hypothetical protein